MNLADRVHRFLSDHGGARVRAQVLTPEDALAEDYQVLIIDDICSFLTPRLVAEVQRQGRLVLGVFDPSDPPDAKERSARMRCGSTFSRLTLRRTSLSSLLRAMVVLAPESRVASRSRATPATAPESSR